MAHPYPYPSLSTSPSTLPATMAWFAHPGVWLARQTQRALCCSQISIHEKRPWARPAVKNVSQEWKTRSQANLNIVSFILIQQVPLNVHKFWQVFPERHDDRKREPRRLVLMGDDSDDMNMTSCEVSHEIHKCWCYIKITLYQPTCPIGTWNSNSNANDIVMNVPQQLDDNILLMTVHVQAVLNVVPHIIGLMEQWDPWMHEKLWSELVSHAVLWIEMDIVSLSSCFQRQLPTRSASSPYPRLLGSLRAMVACHYQCGMRVYMLLFDRVHTDNPGVTGVEFENIAVEALAPLKEGRFWWELLLPSGEQCFIYFIYYHPSKPSTYSEFQQEVGCVCGSGARVTNNETPRPVHKQEDGTRSEEEGESGML